MHSFLMKHVDGHAIARPGPVALTLALIAAVAPVPVIQQEISADPVEWVGQTSLTGSGLAAAEAVCDELTDASGGQIVFTLHPGGTVCPAGQEYQAVEDGLLDFAVQSSFIGYEEEPLFKGRMGGKLPEEKLDWYRNGDGSTLMQQCIDASFSNLKVIPASGVMGPGEVFMHSDVPTDSLGDLDGLRMRTAGDGGVILARMGASTVYLPGSEIEAAMVAGLIDAFEYAGACMNWQAGCQDWATYTYVSDCRAPHDFSPLLVNRSLWNGLDQSTRDALADAGGQTTHDECLDLVAQDEACLQQFVDYPGCEVSDLPESIEQEFRREAYLFYMDKADALGPLYKDVLVSLLRFGQPTDEWIGQCSAIADPQRFALAEELCAEMTAASGGEATFTLLPSWSVCPTLLEGQAVEDGILDFALSGNNGLEYDLPAMKPFTVYMGGMSPEEKLGWYRDGSGTSLLEQGLEDNFDNVSFVPSSGLMGAGEVFLHSRVPLDSPGDWQGLDIRAAGQVGSVHDRMGADVQFLLHPDEIKLALDEGRISAFEYAGACGNWGVGCQDWAQYVYESDCGNAHDFAPFLVSRSLWESIDASTRVAITDAAMQKTLEIADTLETQDEACMQQFRDHPGCTVYGLSPSVKEDFLQKVLQYYRDEIVTHGAFYEEVLRSLESKSPQGIFMQVSGGVSWSGGTGIPSVGDEVYVGTEVQTDETGSVEIAMVVEEGECTIMLNNDTSIEVSDDPAVEPGTIDFFQGKLLTKVKDLPPEGFEVQTPQAVAGSRGTEWIVEGDSDEITITVLSGSVDVSTPDGSESLVMEEGQELVASSTGLGPPSTTPFADVTIDLKTGWNMVSLPAVHPFAMTTGFLLDTAEAIYTWDPATKSYVVPSTIEPEKGYWVAVSSEESVTILGTPITEWTTSVAQGWNMIGSVHGGSPPFTDPNDSIDGSVEGFCYCWDPVTKSYVYVTSIEEGKAYWAACTQCCDLTVCCPGP